MAVLAFFSASHSIADTDYLSRVTAYADTMLQYGCDRYGSETSPLFATALTRDATPELVVESSKFDEWPPRWTALPNVFVESDYAHKITIRGADYGTDVALHKLLWRLSDITGDPHYANAADASLKWWTENTGADVTGLYPWGEHTGWDFRKEQMIDGNDVWKPRPGHPEDYEHWAKHEFQSPMDHDALLDKMATLPDDGLTQFQQHAYSLWTNHIWMDNGRPRWSRHGQMDSIGNETAMNHGGMYPRIGGRMIETWAAVHQYTDDPAVRADMESYIDTLLAEYHLQMDEYGHIPMNIVGVSGSSSEDLSKRQNDILAEALRNAAQRVRIHNPVLADRILAVEERIEPGSLDYFALADPYMSAGIPNRDRGKILNNPRFVDPWDLPGKIPLQYAEAIDALLRAAEENHPAATYTPQQYLTRANALADEALDLFLDDGSGSPLPRMLDKTQPVVTIDNNNPGSTTGIPAEAFYHSYVGGDDLMWSLLNLAIANGEVDEVAPAMAPLPSDQSYQFRMGPLIFGRRYAVESSSDLFNWELMDDFNANSAYCTIGVGAIEGPGRFLRLIWGEDLPPIPPDINLVGAYGVGQVEHSATSSLTVDIFADRVASAFAQNRGGVIDFETAFASSPSLRVGLGAQGRKVLPLLMQTGDIVHIATPPSGREPISGLGCGNGSPDWDVQLGAVEGASGERVTQMGVTVLSRANKPPQDIRVTVYFDDDSTASTTAQLAATQGLDDTFYGFQAPPGRYVDRFTIEMLGGDWTSIDDLAFILSGGF